MMDSGRIIAGRYEIERPVGEGGMGVVFRALDRKTGSQVALKLLRSDELDPTDVDRFVREAEVLAALRHPKIVAYVDHGKTESGRHFLAMEWLDGHHLGNLLERGPLPIDDAITLARGVAEALGVAHAQGVVHRDIKPSNIFLREGRVDRAAVLDFGLARRLGPTRSLTRTGAILGTPNYMAPEQVHGDLGLGPTADVFSLGCVLYECLTGQPPFGAGHVAAVLAKILFQEVRPARALCPDLPEAIEALLERMLAKDAGQRLPDARAVLSALELPGLPRDWPRAGSMPPRSAASLTASEQRILSIVVARSSARERDETTLSEPQGLRATFDRLGGWHAWLPDGSLVAAMVRSDNAVDEVIHAVRCALFVRDALPDAAIALATGRGQLKHGMLAGEVIDRAVSLLDATEFQGIVLDELSADLLRTRFTLTESEGRSVLVGKRDEDDSARLLLGKPTPCVGRNRELATLDSALAECIDAPAAQAMLIMAPPGVGKSRLRHEFLRRTRATGHVVEVLIGVGAQSSAGSPYGLMGQALRRFCGVPTEGPLSTQREKFRAHVARHLPVEDAPRVQDFLGELCGIPSAAESAPLRAARADPRLMAEQIQRAFVDFIRAECAHGAVILVLDDMQWSDALTLKLVDVTLRDAADLPLFVLALARPEVKDHFPGLWRERPHQEIRLSGLSKKASEQLAREVLGASEPPDVVARIAEIASGNAFFLEEMIRAVAEGKGDITPDTVVAIAQARLVRLDPIARRVLRAASVFGVAFRRDGVLSLLGPELSELDIDAALDALVDAEVVERRREAGDDYGFRHSLMRDAAYDLLTETDRELGHELAERYLDQLGGVDPIVLAEHALRGGQKGRAILHFTRAAEQSFERNDLEEALSRAGRGLSCGARGTERGVLLALQCEAYFARGADAWTEADAVASEALELLPPGSLWWCRAMGRLAFLLPNMLQNDRMRLLTECFATTPPEPDGISAYVATSAYFLGMLAVMGDRESVDAFSQRLDELAICIDQDDALAQGFISLAHSIRLLMLEANPYQQLLVSRQSVECFERAEDQRNLMFMLHMLGAAQICIGDPATAEHTLLECRRMAQRLGDEFMEVQCLCWCVWALSLMERASRLADARAMALEVIEGSAGPADKAWAHGLLARVLLLEGEAHAAEAEAHGRIAVQGMEGVVPHQLSVISPHLRALVALGRADEARTLWDKGLAILDAVDGTGFSEVDFLSAAAEAMFATGDDETGRRTLARALERIRVRSERILDPEMRRRFEEDFAESQRVRDLAARFPL